MSSGLRPSVSSAKPAGDDLSAAEQLQRFLKGNTRSRQRLWLQLQGLGSELYEPIWEQLEQLDRLPTDWATGSLLRLLAVDPEQLLKLQQTYSDGWLIAPSVKHTTYSQLQLALLVGDLQEADRLTSVQLRRLAGPAAEDRGYVYFSEVSAMPEADVSFLDTTWWFYSNGRFSFRVQRQMLERLDWRWEELWPRIGWKQDGVWTRYPGAFTWSHDAPDGHMPLVNQLRGVRLMDALLRHPAIDRVCSSP